MSTTIKPANAGAELWAKKDYGKTYRSGAETVMQKPIIQLVEQSGVAEAVRSGRRVDLWDNACGTGSVTANFISAVRDLPNTNWSVTGTDFSESMLETAKERAQEESWPNVEFHIADAQDTKLPDAKFTHALTSFAFGIIPNSDAALDEISRSLIPGGTIGITTWEYISWPDLLQKCLEFAGSPLVIGDFLAAGNKRSGYNWASRDALQKLLTDRGYTDIKTTPAPTVSHHPKERFLQAVKSSMLALVMARFTAEERAKWEDKVVPALDEHWTELFGEDGQYEMHMNALVTTATKPVA